MTSETAKLITDIAEVLNDERRPPRENNAIADLVQKYDRLVLSHSFSKFFLWVRFQKFPSQRTPLDVPGICGEVLKIVIARSTDLTNMFKFVDENVEFEAGCPLELRQDLSELIRKTYRPQIDV
jgi:hypothetical protein